MHFLAEHPGLWFVAATLLPLVSVVLLLLAGFLRNALRASKNDGSVGQSLFHLLGGEVTGRGPAYVATAAIGLAFVCSFIGFVTFLRDHAAHHQHEEHAAAEAKGDEQGAADDKVKKDAKPGKGEDKKHSHGKEAKPADEDSEDDHDHKAMWAGSITWASVFPKANSQDPERGSTLKLGYFIDHLSAIMFVMVTFIATLIHLFSIGYMSDELQQTVEDHQVHTDHGHFHRRGRFGRFFMFLSLFCFSMLNLILADNLFQVFVELGTGRRLLVSADRLLLRTHQCRQRGQQGVHHQPRRRCGLHHRPGHLWTYVGTLNFQDIFQRLRAPDQIEEKAVAWLASHRADIVPLAETGGKYRPETPTSRSRTGRARRLCPDLSRQFDKSGRLETPAARKRERRSSRCPRWTGQMAGSRWVTLFWRSDSDAKEWQKVDNAADIARRR